MFCPVCKSELIVTGQERLETLDEHVSCVEEISFKNKYECSNPNCPTQGVACWNEDGEFYVNDWGKSNSLQFIDNNNAPFGSFQRQANVEIYKKDEDYTLLTIGRYRFKIKFHYISNKNGDILKRKWKLEIWVREHKFGGEMLYISGIHMLLFSICRFHRNIRNLKKGCDWCRNEIKSNLFLEDWQKKDWWRRVACWYINQYLKLIGV